MCIKSCEVSETNFPSPEKFLWIQYLHTYTRVVENMRKLIWNSLKLVSGKVFLSEKKFYC